jgi:hypothetical protein
LSAVAHIKEYKTGKFFSDEFRGPMSWNGYENNVLLKNLGTAADGTPQFVDVAMALGADDVIDSRGAATADFDNDGDLDLVINHNPGDRDREIGVPPTLLRNDLGSAKSWLAVELEGTTSNRDGVGAVVTATAAVDPSADDPLTLTRLATAGTGYASQETLRLYFGLGEAGVVDELAVTWPAGGEERFRNVPVGKLVRLTEGRGMEVLELPRTPGDLAVPPVREPTDPVVADDGRETTVAPTAVGAGGR